jgi:methylmalonyl-CoA mutase C-terminal domain/subunit
MIGQERSRPIRVLVGKMGLDGHDRGARVVARCLRDAGMEVVYTGLHLSPEQVAHAAVEEDVDVVGISILSGAHMTLFPLLIDALRAQGVDVPIVAGGLIPDDDAAELAAMGVQLISQEAPLEELVERVRAAAADDQAPADGRS